MLFRKAILIIHGFAGGTYDEEDLANYLELNKFYDVYQYTLPGHSKNLSKVKYQDWIKKSEDMMDFLISNGYKTIYIIGHSMGGVIATYLAGKYKQVRRLVLCAPAFQYLSVEKDKKNIKESLKSTQDIVKTYGSDEILSRFLKLNPTSLKEFSNLILKYYDTPKKVYCPVLILQGKNDDIVPISSSSYVYENINSSLKKIIYLNDVNHDIFKGERSLEVIKIIESFLKKTEEGENVI